MKFNFTDEQKNEGFNKIELEDEDIILYGEYVEGEGKYFIISGKAVIEGETYHDFQIEFEIVKEVGNNIEEIMEAEWESYDFLC